MKSGGSLLCKPFDAEILCRFSHEFGRLLILCKAVDTDILQQGSGHIT